MRRYLSLLDALKKPMLLLFIFSTFAGFMFVFSGTSNAISDKFPDPNDFDPVSADVYAVVAVANGTSYLLDAPTSNVRVYVPTSIPIVDISVISPGYNDTGDVGNVETEYGLWGIRNDSLYTQIGPGRIGGANTPNFNFRFTNSSAYASSIYPGYNIYEIDAYNTNAGFGWNSFKLDVNAGAYISYFNDSKYPDWDKFALKALDRTGSKNFHLKFSPPCSQTNIVSKSLRYFDADAGEANQQFRNPVNTYLNGINKPIYNVDIPSSRPQIGNGGNGDSGRFDVSLGPTQYDWEWRAIWEDNGIQFGLPFDGFASVFRAQGHCGTTQTVGSSCTITSNILNDQPDVPVGTPLSLSAHSTNNGTTIWNNNYIVFFSYGVAQPGSVPPRIHKYGSTRPPNAQADADNIILSQGQSSPEVTTLKGGQTLASLVDMNTPGPKSITLSVDHIVTYAPPTITWLNLGSCTLSFTVVPPPVFPVINLNNGSCSGINFTIGWNNGQAVNMTGQINLQGVARAFVLPPGNHTFTFSDFPGVPLHLATYTVTLIVEGEENSMQFTGNCVDPPVCSPASYEFGAGTPLTLNYIVNNKTNGTNGGYAFNFGGIVNSTISQTLVPGQNTFSYTFPTGPVVGGSITGVLLYGGAQASPIASCVITVLRYPYVQTFGADVMAGGGFDTGSRCSSASGIFARMRPLNQHVAGGAPDQNKSGSGSQLGAFAWGGDILGFASATLRSNASAGNALTFSGEGTQPDFLTNGSAKMGGNLSGRTPCMPDYYADTAYDIVANPTKTAIGSGNITPGAPDDGKQIFYNGPGDVTVNTMNSYSGRRTYYINGNLIIKGDIKYANTGNYGTIADIPNFTVVVKGNIYIDPSVKNLDGVYIAQPINATTGGKIYTCAATTGAGTPRAHISDTEVFASCSNYHSAAGQNISQLVVNGSFIAQKVILNRALNTLSESRFQEPSDPNNKSAEIFNFTPELFLSPPIFRPKSTPTSGNYNSIAVLPPIL